MFETRTDLALEAHEVALKNKKSALDGVIFREEERQGYKLTRVEIISENGERETGKPMGTYLTLDAGRIWDRGIDELKAVSQALGESIRELTKKCDSLLVVGLGNTTVTADALGPEALSHLIVTRHLKSASPRLFGDMGFFDISAIAPGVLSQTGIETMEIVKSVVQKLKPSLVIAIDALASRDMSRLGTVIQISDTGIAPGSGVGNHRPALNEDSLGVPVISMGIPTVVDALTLTANVVEMCGVSVDSFVENAKVEECKNMFVTPKDSDKIISYMSKAIGYAINMAFHTELSFEEMISISS
ncbi:MAG: GPR endopeptidase [Clostridia bacterium]|nr:GPR endopeptidase [Clostridia bacterium]